MGLIELLGGLNYVDSDDGGIAGLIARIVVERIFEAIASGLGSSS